MSKIFKVYSIYRETWLQFIPLTENNMALELEQLDFDNLPKYLYGRIAMDTSLSSFMYKSILMDKIKIVDLPEKQN